MQIAVTGSSGEFGRVLAPFLEHAGHDVIRIDRTLAPAPGAPIGRANDLVVDVTDFGQLAAALRGADALIHLAAHRTPRNHPDTVVYRDNTLASYNALAAAALLGIERVCLASSINAIGGAFSRSPRYDYFPLDEQHPCYAEDPYSLSKWVLEQQADAFARRYEWMRIASLRFHWLLPSYEDAVAKQATIGRAAERHLWAYTGIEAACRACALALEAPFSGHEVFYIVAPRTTQTEPSAELAHRVYAQTPIRGELREQQGFFDCSKAERVLGWRHEE